MKWILTNLQMHLSLWIIISRPIDKNDIYLKLYFTQEENAKEK